jgi:ribosomal protein S1
MSSEEIVDRVVEGTVIRVSPTSVFVRLTPECAGPVDPREFGTRIPKEGDTVEVWINGIQDGIADISYERAQMVRSWEELYAHHLTGQPVPGRIVRALDGNLGFRIDLGEHGIAAWLPSQTLSSEDHAALDEQVGGIGCFRITKFDRQKGAIEVAYQRSASSGKGG